MPIRSVRGRGFSGRVVSGLVDRGCGVRGIRGSSSYSRCSDVGKAVHGNASEVQPSIVRLSIVQMTPRAELLVESPFNESVIGACRRCDGAFYDSNAGGWRVPLTDHDRLFERLDVLRREGSISSIQPIPNSVLESLRLPQATPPTLLLPEKLQSVLLPHQRAAVAFAVANGNRALIADDMGLGKTLTAIAIIAHSKCMPALVICPSSVKFNWRAEVLSWLPTSFVSSEHIQASTRRSHFNLSLVLI